MKFCYMKDIIYQTLCERHNMSDILCISCNKISLVHTHSWTASADLELSTLDTEKYHQHIRSPNPFRLENVTVTIVAQIQVVNHKL